MTNLKRTPLYDTHVALGGRMVEFGGWEMPVQYSGILDEHHAVRTAAGLFDTDHMGQFEVTGKDALPFLQHLLTANIEKLELYEAGYGILCYPDGGVVDDTFTYKLPGKTKGTFKYIVVVNASNREKDFAWMRAHRGDWRVKLEDLSDRLYMLAFQGPKAEAVLQKLESFDLSKIKYHRARHFGIGKERGLIARTGYTGEDGFELFIPVSHGKHVWDAILDAGKDAGVKPIGLGARDSLRFEAKMPLYGHEMDAQTTPLEAGLGWACDLDKQFSGRDALLKQKLEGVKKKLVGFEMIDRGIARSGHEITQDGRAIGAVTTGMFSPTLQKNIGLGFVKPEFTACGTEFEIVVRGNALKARVIKTPFYANRARGK
ncbi:MAG: glycine cleavage system aminomethyltransferase GcvT [Chloroflexi bacterium]|nr:glycine cleavage system aminomethyltransferase GcvT [Chloroflexota bacterium]